MISLILPFILATTTLAAQASAAPVQTPIDVATLKSLVITGGASTVTISTDAGAPYRASLTGRRAGWFGHWYSIWFPSDCDGGGAMRLEAGLLRIDITAPSWFELGDCVTEVQANIPAESTVSIDHKSLQARLSGDFSAVTIDSDAADVELDGHATSIALSGDAMRAHLAFDATHQNESIGVKARALDAYLSFARDTKISYAINAKASFVDSSLPNSAGARPEIAIDGDFVRATIR